MSKAVSRGLIRVLIGMAALSSGQLASADVDTANLSYTTSFSIDVDKQAHATIPISYRSRSLYVGMFGFGWCSDLETRVAIGVTGGFDLRMCGDGKSTRFLPIGAHRGVSPDFANIIARRGKGKIRPPSVDGSPVPLDDPANVRGLLERGVTAESLLELVGAEVPPLGAGDYAGDDGSHANFDGGTIRLTAADGERYEFNAGGRLVKSVSPSGMRLTIVERTTRSLTFDLNGVRATLDLNGDLFGERLRSSNRVLADFGYKRMSGRTVLSSIRSDGRNVDLQYTKYLNLVETRINGRPRERVIYDDERDWVRSVEDVAQGCTDTYKAESQPDKEVIAHLANLKRLVELASTRVPDSSYYTITHRKCRGEPESVVAMQGYAYGQSQNGDNFQAMAVTWLPGRGSSVAEYLPNGQLLAVTQPPIGVRSTLDGAAGTLSNSLFSARYRDSTDCEVPLSAEGVIYPPALSRPLPFRMRAQRTVVAGSCVISNVEWETPGGIANMQITRNSDGTWQTYEFDAQHRYQRSPTPPSPSNPAKPCSLRDISSETDEKRIATRVARALEPSCGLERQRLNQIALVLSVLQSIYICSCELNSSNESYLADFSRSILLDEFVAVPAR